MCGPGFAGADFVACGVCGDDGGAEPLLFELQAAVSASAATSPTIGSRRVITSTAPPAAQ